MTEDITRRGSKTWIWVLVVLAPIALFGVIIFTSSALQVRLKLPSDERMKHDWAVRSEATERLNEELLGYWRQGKRDEIGFWAIRGEPFDLSGIPDEALPRIREMSRTAGVTHAELNADGAWYRTYPYDNRDLGVYRGYYFVDGAAWSKRYPRRFGNRKVSTGEIARMISEKGDRHGRPIHLVELEDGWYSYADID